MRNKKIIVPAIALGAIILGTSVYVTGALAFQGPSEERRSEMAQELSDKLGIEKDKVATAMDEIRSERREAREAEVSSKLDKAVSDGVITAQQKQQILDKQVELRGQGGKNREEMQQWFEDNGIDSDKIHDYIGFGGGMGRGRGTGRTLSE